MQTSHQHHTKQMLALEVHDHVSFGPSPWLRPWGVWGKAWSGQAKGCRPQKEGPWRSAHFLVKKIRLKAGKDSLEGFEPLALCGP